MSFRFLPVDPPVSGTQSFDIVVSSSNVDYLAWQCMVFHHSCMTHIGQAPIIVVHGDDEPLSPGYEVLEENGGIIQRLPTMADAGAIHYPPRNAWASLKGVKSEAEYIILFDPDVIFLRRFDFGGAAARLSNGSVSLDAVGYMKVGNDNRAILEDVCRKSWINPRDLDRLGTSGGMPYIIPMELRRRIAREWADLTEEVLEVSFRRHGSMNSAVWISVMWGFALACLRLEIPMTLTNITVTNHEGQANEAEKLAESYVAHYCFGDQYFNKKRFIQSNDARIAVWQAWAPSGTVSGSVTAAIQEAGKFFGVTRHAVAEMSQSGFIR